MIHLTIQQLSSLLDEELSEASAALAREHLTSCESCSSKFARLGKQEEALARALGSDPEDEFFERFTRRLEERIQSEGPKLIPAKPASSEREQSAPMAHASATPASAAHASVAPASAAHASAAQTSRLAPLAPTSRAPGSRADTSQEAHPVRPVYEPLAHRILPSSSAQRQNGGPFPWAAAILIVAIAGGIGAFLFGTELVSYLLGASGLSSTQPRSAPLTRPGADDLHPPQYATAELGSPASEPPTDAPPPSTAKPVDRTVKSHESSTEEDSSADLESREEPTSGGTGESAATYEAAASDWEQSLASLHGDEYRAARLHLAEARYRAWKLEPTKERAARVVGAIRAFLVGSQPGIDRENATRWLSEVEGSGY